MAKIVPNINTTMTTSTLELKRQKSIEALLLFRSIDVDGDNCVSSLEFMTYLSDFGIPDDKVEALFYAMDTSADGTIDLCEFEQAFDEYIHITNDSAVSATPRAVPISRKYLISDTLLGEGGFASVMKGKLRDSGEPVAVKVIGDNVDCGPIKQEVALLRSCQHPGVIKFMDFIHESPNYYMVTELVEGGELFDRIVSKEAYAEADARKVILTLLRVTEHLHSLGIVHRDYKPENLLLKSMDDDSDMRLCDFGFATLAKGRSLTQVVGTPGYMAPELLKDEVYGAEVDLWSTGVLLYILIEGAAPFYDEDPDLLDEQVKAAVLDFDPEAWDPVSTEAKQLVQQLLQQDPENRITAAQALRHSWFDGDDCMLKTHQCRCTYSSLQKVKKDLAAVRLHKTIRLQCILRKSLSNLSPSTSLRYIPSSPNSPQSPIREKGTMSDSKLKR